VTTTRWAKAAMAAAACAGVLAGIPAEALAAESDRATERHCVAEVVDERDGVLVTGPERCYRTFEEAAADSTAESGDVTSMSSTNTIGLHFTGTSFSGSSIRITGTVCAGGVWYPSSSWNNNIASSYHYCGSAPTTFYDYSSCGGTSLSIYSSVTTLSSMNDRASCVRYG
jgi:hypothetical protein